MPPVPSPLAWFSSRPHRQRRHGRAAARQARPIGPAEPLAFRRSFGAPPGRARPRASSPRRRPARRSPMRA